MQLPTFSSEADLFRAVRKRHGKAYANRLRQLLRSPDGPEAYAERYELLFESLETARTFQLALLNAGLIECMTWWSRQPLTEGAVLDLGCGAGFAACYFAMTHPDREVVGVDIEPKAVACATELARSLNLDNVSFTATDIHDFSTATRFANVNSFYTIAAAADFSVEQVGGFTYLPPINDLMESPRNPVTSRIEALLAPDGIVTCVERMPNVLLMATLIGSFEREAIGLQPRSITEVPSLHAFHGQEITTAAVFTRQSEPTARRPSVLRDLAARFDDFGHEHRAAALPDVRFRRGVEVWWPPEDDGPDPIAHVYDFVSGGVHFYYETTTRGYRYLEAQERDSVLGDNPAFERAIDQYTPLYEGQCEHRPLTFSDLQRDLNQSEGPLSDAGQ